VRWSPGGRAIRLHGWRGSELKRQENTMNWLHRPDIPAILAIVVVLYLAGSPRVLKQYERGVVFFFGKFEGSRGPGLTLIFLPVQQMVRVSLRTVTMQVPSQKIITKDNVSIDIAAVAYYHVSNPEKAVIAIEDVYDAINQISQTTVRNVVGRFNLDQLLSDTSVSLRRRPPGIDFNVGDTFLKSGTMIVSANG
jgi:regulator of protease activity HflC (stomatin/prohibitin superfamily)